MPLNRSARHALGRIAMVVTVIAGLATLAIVQSVRLSDTKRDLRSATTERDETAMRLEEVCFRAEGKIHSAAIDLARHLPSVELGQEYAKAALVHAGTWIQSCLGPGSESLIGPGYDVYPDPAALAEALKQVEDALVARRRQR